MEDKAFTCTLLFSLQVIAEQNTVLQSGLIGSSQFFRNSCTLRFFKLCPTTKWLSTARRCYRVWESRQFKHETLIFFYWAMLNDYFTSVVNHLHNSSTAPTIRNDWNGRKSGFTLYTPCRLLVKNRSVCCNPFLSAHHPTFYPNR